MFEHLGEAFSPRRLLVSGFYCIKCNTAVWAYFSRLILPFLLRLIPLDFRGAGIEVYLYNTFTIIYIEYQEL